MEHPPSVLTQEAVLPYPPEGGGCFRLALLGGFSFQHGDQRIALPLGAQRLLAFVALAPRPLPRAYVAGTLWPDSTDAQAAASLRSALWRLGRPGLPLIEASGSHLCLVEGLAVDADEANTMVRRLLDRSKPCRPKDLDPSLLAGELLPDWNADDWILVERERLRQLCLHGLEVMCERLLAVGRYADAIHAGLQAVRGEPLRESAHRGLIAVHLAEGNYAEALRQYRWFERLLRNELGVPPSPRITGLVNDLLLARNP